jgi:murein DD-endopeptidase MepM/ murein hydrolase activator NlpD
VFQISKLALVAFLGVNSAQAVQHRLPLPYVPYLITSWFDHSAMTGIETRYDGADIPIGSSFYEDGHKGTDFDTPRGVSVYASAKGEMYRAPRTDCPESSGPYDSCGGGLGNNITIMHPDGIISIYAHLTSVFVFSGTVPCGTQIGTTGNSGATKGRHLHYELRAKGMDPAIYPSYDPFGGNYGQNYWYDWAIIPDNFRGIPALTRYPVTTCQPGQL